MIELLLYAGKSSVCLLAFYLLFYFLLRKETCFGYNRGFLLGAVALSFLLPLIELPAIAATGTYATAIARLNTVYHTLPANASMTPEVFALSWQHIVWAVYLAGLCVFSFRFLRQLYQLVKLVEKYGADTKTYQDITYILTNGTYPTFSFFHYIFLNDDQGVDMAEKGRILLHERAHVQQLHSYDMLFFEVVQIFFWFNPLLLLYKKALVATHEFLADAHVIQSEDTTSYGLLLAKQALQNTHFSLGHYFNQSLTLTRLQMIHKTNYRPARFKQFLALPLLAVLVVSLSSNTPSLPVVSNTSGLATQKQLVVSQDPKFPGGPAAFLKAFYPAPVEATKRNEYGSVILQVTIKEDGSLTDYKVLQASHASLEKFVVNTFQQMPNWEPAKAGTTSVATTHVFPFFFVVNGFGNDKAAINKQNNAQLARVTATIQDKAVKIHDVLACVTYGPEK